jgi:hypothetical protein
MAPLGMKTAYLPIDEVSEQAYLVFAWLTE